MRILTTIILLAVSLSSYAISLEGVWQSDKNLTVEYNSKNAQLTDRQSLFLSEILGILTVTYNNGTFIEEMPDTKVTVKGKQEPFKGFTLKGTYKILGQNADTITIESTEPNGTNSFSIIRFVNENEFWIYVPNSSTQYSQLNIREYFVRKK